MVQPVIEIFSLGLGAGVSSVPDLMAMQSSPTSMVQPVIRRFRVPSGSIPSVLGESGGFIIVTPVMVMESQYKGDVYKRQTPQYLSGLFKKSFNKNFSAYITVLRLENAFSLMKNPKLTLTEIALRSGFTNYLALARAFQKYENQTPGEYRRTHNPS